jgi:hypothetical protein
MLFIPSCCRAYTIGERFDRVVNPFWERDHEVRQVQEVEVVSVAGHLALLVVPAGDPRDDPLYPGVARGVACVGCGEAEPGLPQESADGRVLCPNCRIKAARGVPLPVGRSGGPGPGADVPDPGVCR